jgi:NAD(P)-dependent dehydrogenase (short-subunit alcohol dehydrogenase family)
MADRMCEGRVCIITGAGRGIGREHALMLADNGALVMVNDIGGAVSGGGSDVGPAQQVVDEILAAGGHAAANTDDISTWDGAERLIAQTVETFGRLDVLINNAGIIRDRMLVNMSEEDWDSVMKVHLKGTFCPTRHAAAYWRDRAKAGETNDARIINTTSRSGIYGNVGQANYGAAKAGIASFTSIVAMELKRYGVTANAVAPAGLTRMTENLNLDEEMKKNWDPRWVSPVIVWLASSRSADVTNRVFEASGLRFGIAEGWHPGPGGGPVGEVSEIEKIAREYLAESRQPFSIVAGNQ